MKMIFTCSSEDIEFIDKVNEKFASFGTIEETRISGITGYEIVMLVLQVASVSATQGASVNTGDLLIVLA